VTTLAVSKDLFARYGRLDPSARNRVEELAVKCQQLTMQELRDSKGLNLEPYANQRDPRARTIRLGDNHRGIVMLPDRAEMIVLVDILTHDEADRWMLRNEFRVNEATGALEVVDVSSLGALIAETTPVKAVPDAAAPLYAHRSDKEFTQLGVDESLLPLLRVVQNEDQLEPLLAVVPQGQADALIMLTGDESTEVLYAALVGQEGPTKVDTDDLAAAVTAPASRSQFHVIEDQAELAEMLAKPMAVWRIYLHPTQHEAAYKPTYNGPARVTGGAGTGKTVVAIHRARALADTLDPGVRGRPILFTTFTRNLAQSIERDLVSLGGSDLLERIEVLNVDRVAHQVVADSEGAAPGIVDPDRLKAMWQTAIDNVGLDLPVTFVLQEWEQVVLAQGIDSRDAYLTASRAGRGTPLDRRARAQVWKVVEAATGEMAHRRQRTFLQIASDAAGYLNTSAVKPYRHVVVDEAQDLHEAQWRLLRAAVAPGPNDMFIVGDSHQRIYDRRSSLSKVGIEVRGRSRRLRINYRTTHEILRWSLAVLGEGDFDDLDTGTATQDRAGYHSFLHGAPPTVAGFDTAAEMAAGLAERVSRWIKDGVEPSEIGVAVRAQGTFSVIERALRDAGVRCFRLGRDLKFGEGVALGTMHRMKGLEYRCVAVVGVGADQVPSPAALAAVSGDAAEVALETRRERCLLYVACTRAREDLWVGFAGEPSPFLGPPSAPG
jgi:hypothetical protein